MSIDTEKIRADLTILSEVERAELAQFLIRSLDRGTEDDDADLTWDAELARRSEEVVSGKAKGEPAEKVFSELHVKYS